MISSLAFFSPFLLHPSFNLSVTHVLLYELRNYAYVSRTNRSLVLSQTSVLESSSVILDDRSLKILIIVQDNPVYIDVDPMIK